MTSASAVLDTTEEAPPKPTRRGVAGVLLRVLPWLLPAAALVFGLHHTHTPARYIAVYAAYFAVVIVLPGTLVHRALRGSRGNLPEDLGLGAATGLLVLLIGWALCAATRTQELLPAWPLLVVAPFVVVPRLRRRVWRIPAEQRRPLPVAWSWIVAVALVVIVMINLPIWTVVPLPPATATYYQDLMYHLALIHEMTRSIPFQVPQLAGDTLRYHYLSDADMAAASMITKIPIPVVLFRLWIVPIEGLAIFVAAALGRRLTGKWWAGALAGVSSVLVIPLTLGSPQGASGGTPIQIYSPSQTYVLPLVGLLIMLAVDVLGGERLGRAWIMVFPLAVACAGAKSSALPPFVAGLLLAAVVVAVRARERLLATGAFLGLTVVAVYLGTKIFAGGGGSVLSLQPLAVLFWFAPYKKTLGVGDTNDGTLPLPLGVSHADTAGLLFIAGLVCWWLAMQAPRMLGIAALVTRRTRTEPAAWLLAGIGMSGGGAMWLLWHPASSQTYFFLCAAPFATMLTVWLLADLARGWRAVVAGLLAGALWAEFAPKVALPAHNTVRDWAWVLGLPLLRAAAAACAAAVTGLVTWRLVTGRLAWRAVPVALVAAVLGAGLAGRVDGESRSSYAALTKPPAKGNPGRAIHADEARAALWLDEHAGNDDVVATNVHCADLSWTAACDARAFWVAGLGGRRTLVESWAYTDQAVAANGVNGKGFALQPAPYPDRFALNQRVFAKGDQADVTRLKDEYHVKWLFADSRAQGGASPNLAKAATLRYTSGTVTVYEVR